MTSLLANVKRWDDAFLPWRMPADSVWLTTDIGELRAMVEIQSLRAMRLAEAFGVKELQSDPHHSL